MRLHQGGVAVSERRDEADREQVLRIEVLLCDLIKLTARNQVRIGKNEEYICKLTDRIAFLEAYLTLLLEERCDTPSKQS